MSNFIKRMEGGEDDFILATEIPGCCVKAKMRKNNNDMFEVSFRLPKNLFDKMPNDYFFNHHFMIVQNGIKVLVQNRDIYSIKYKVNLDDDEVSFLLLICSFSMGIENRIWEEQGKQEAICFYNHQCSIGNFGIMFDMTTSVNQNLGYKNCLKINLCYGLFLLYFEKINNQQCFVLKTQGEILHKDFLCVLKAVRTALGLLSGYYIEERTWFFCKKVSNQIGFRYEYSDESILNDSPVLDGNLYKNSPEIERKLTTLQFAEMIKLFLKHEEVLNSSMLLIQAAAVKGISKGSLASVALETIKNIVFEKTSDRNCKEIVDSDTFDIMRGKFIADLNSMKSTLSKDSYNRLMSKIAQLNQCSNAEKLESPFETLKINLTEDEKYCLKCRNNFLHGSIPKPNKGKVYPYLTSKELIDIIGSRLIMLTAMLILKKCGFKGKVVDWGLTRIIKIRAIDRMQRIAHGGNAFRTLN